jgi:hypothetical protein
MKKLRIRDIAKLLVTSYIFAVHLGRKIYVRSYNCVNICTQFLKLFISRPKSKANIILAVFISYFTT